MTELAATDLTLHELVTAWAAADSQAVADPYPLFKRLRQEAPRLRLNNRTFISRADDIAAVSLDRVMHKGGYANPGWRVPDDLPEPERERQRLFGHLMRLQLNMLEGDQHARMRGLVQKAFTPRTVEGRRALVQGLIDELLEARSGRSEIELVSEFAFHLPLIVVCEILDIPREARFQIREWGQALIAGPDVSFRQAGGTIPEVTLNAMVELDSFLREHLRWRRKQPANSSSLLSALIEAEAAGDKLSEDELIGTMTILVFAGHETTTNQIGNGIVALMRNRDQWDRLLDAPELIPTAVEEILRYDSAVQTNPRWATEPHEVGDMPFGEDENVVLIYGSANRDEGKFDNPDVFDVGREPNRHLSFGVGRHFCLGASLTRLEIAMVLETMLRRFPDMDLSEQPVFRPSVMLRGVEALLLSLGADRG